MPPEERRRHYQELAEDALQRATVTYDQKARAELLSASASWHAMAEDLRKNGTGDGSRADHAEGEGGQ